MSSTDQKMKRGKSKLSLSYLRQKNSGNPSKKKSNCESKLSLSVLKSKKYEITSSESKYGTPQFEMDVDFIDDNSTSANTCIKIISQFQPPIQSIQNLLPQPTIHSSIIVDDDFPSSQEIEIPPTPGAGYELKLVNHYTLEDRSKFTQTDAVSTLNKSTLTDEIPLMTENEIAVSPSNILPNFDNLQNDLAAEISDLNIFLYKYSAFD